MSVVELAGVAVADRPEDWRAAGFVVGDDGTCQVGALRIRLVGREAGAGIVGWSLRRVPTGTVDVDGVPTEVSGETAGEGAVHPNGVVGVDHVVLLSPDLRRTVAAFGALGVEPRRHRDGELGGRAVRQVFFRLGAVILEVVGSPDTAVAGPSTLWGLTYVVADIDTAAAFFGEHTSPVKDAVQPGRRITTLRHRDLGLSVRTALISPHQRARG
ncbi:MAG: hypothetical protein NTV23_11380 [Propionibacteriales bacterium]|nr:hypothetical protein [Propionibacteriales bacterium]